MIPQDDSFPRGGVKAKRNKADTPKEVNLFSTFKDNKKVKAKKAKAKVAARPLNNFEETFHSTTASVISYKSIFDGMLILGCVRKIKSLTVEVELPGRVYGEIWIKSISQQYYNELNRKINEDEQTENLNDLNKIFTVGQLIPIKVLSINDVEKKNKIILSTNPADINSSFQHKSLEKGMLLWGAIVEKSDHCYLVDIGVKDSRVVLPFSKIDPGVEYDVGQPFYSVITKCVISKEAATVTVSALGDDIDRNVENVNKNLDHFIPGMQVNFNIQKVLMNGLEGNILNNCVSYINQMYLTDPCISLNNFNVGDNVKARVMYIQPITKFVFLTLRDLTTVPGPRLSVGKNEQATVVKKLGNGLLLKFRNNEKGFITFKRIIKSMSNNKTELENVLSTKYENGSKHTCRLLDYNRMDRVFICTFESSELNKKILTKSDIKHGEILEGVITEVNNYGLVVQIDKLTGFVPNIHTSNSEFTKNIKKKYKEGQKIKAKVWFIDPNSDSVKLTMKQDLLKSSDDLLDYKSIEINKTYMGVVMAIKRTGALVVFYGGVKGWLPSRNIPHFDNTLNKAFFIGQVIKCVVEEVQDQRVTLTLNKDVLSNDFEIGDVITSAKINHINAEGLFLTIGDEKTPGFLPWPQMFHPSLREDAMALYENGDEINSLLCINNKAPITLSLLEKRDFASIRWDFDDFKLKYSERNVIKAYFLKKVNGGIKIAIPFKKQCMEFIVKNELVMDNNLISEIKFKSFQQMMVKVFPEKSPENKLSIRTELSQVFNYDYNQTLDRLQKYLTDLQSISEVSRAKQNILGKIKIGDKLQCVVKDFNPESGCDLSAKSGKIEGFADITHCAGKLEKDSTLTGVVLWIDYKCNKVIFSLKSEIVNKVMKHCDEVTENIAGTNVFIQILYVNEDCAIAVVNCKEYRGQILYLPVRLHENDFLPTLSFYQSLLFNKVKAVLQRNFNGKLLGMEKNIQKLLDSNFKKIEKKVKRKAANEEIETPVVKKSKFDNKKIDQKDSSKSNKSKQNLSDQQISEKTESEKTTEENTSIRVKRKINEDIDVTLTEDNSATIEENKTVAKKAKTLKSVKDLKEKKKIDTKSAETSKMNKKVDVEEEITAGPILPGIGSFFSAPETNESGPSDSDDDDEEKDSTKKKKRKLTQAQKAEIIQKEEERLRKIENELADASNIPQTAEHFDRALLGNPDNSEMWLRYIAFHVQSTELEKARSVAKRALDKISYNSTQERLNVWLAYLNLENMYGTKESFENVFIDATRCNDSLTVHLEAIKMLAEMQKYDDMEEKIKKTRPKFKQEIRMWLEIGRIYYKCKRFADARKVKDAALKTLLNKKEHINLIVKFALMEMTLGEENHGEALFETILQSDPKRVDVWSTYVDQLVKNNKIDLARNVLIRAVGQKLPYKKMKTLFKKYLAFEKTHGDDESVENVKEMLKEYVS